MQQLKLIVRLMGGLAFVFALTIAMGCGVGGLTTGPDVEAAYPNLQSGMTLAEVEALLGAGRTPTTADFDAICGDGEFQSMNPRAVQRPIWERAASDGTVLAWSNGSARLLIFFHQNPATGGKLFQKVLLYPDGSVSLQADSSFLMAQPGGDANVTPEKP